MPADDHRPVVAVVDDVDGQAGQPQGGSRPVPAGWWTPPFFGIRNTSGLPSL